MFIFLARDIKKHGFFIITRINSMSNNMVRTYIYPALRGCREPKEDMANIFLITFTQLAIMRALHKVLTESNTRREALATNSLKQVFNSWRSYNLPSPTPIHIHLKVKRSGLIFLRQLIPRFHTVITMTLLFPHQAILIHILRQMHIHDFQHHIIRKQLSNFLNIPLFSIRQHEVIKSKIVHTLSLWSIKVSVSNSFQPRVQHIVNFTPHTNTPSTTKRQDFPIF